MRKSTEKANNQYDAIYITRSKTLTDELQIQTPTHQTDFKTSASIQTLCNIVNKQDSWDAVPHKHM